VRFVFSAYFSEEPERSASLEKSEAISSHRSGYSS
jgi:hypothetical protein